jgi:[acyl-carrier-protein] S-malonyltransferase
MQIACDQRPGTMAAILGMDESTLLKITTETGTHISNVNSPGQIVISGDHSGIYKAMEMAMMQGAKKTVPLRVGGAFHSGLMEPALQGLEEAIDKLRFNEPKIPIVANCTAEPLHTANDLKKELVAQITGCVQWSRSIEYMSRAGVGLFIEVGTGKALTGMVKRIIKGVQVASMGDLDSIRSFELS